MNMNILTGRALKGRIGLPPPSARVRRYLSGAASSGSRVVAVKAAATSREAEVRFGDGSAFLFHALWLRDACRDAAHVEAQSERVLTASPLVSRLPHSVGIKGIATEDDGRSIVVEWDHGDVERSTFEAGFLRALAPSAGKLLTPPDAAAAADAADTPKSAAVGGWFEFLNGKHDTPVPPPSELGLWDASAPRITRLAYADIASGRVSRDEMLRAIIDPGATIVEGMPDDPRYDGSALAEFAAEYLGGLQKHPRRDNAHWTISTEETVTNSNMVAGTGDATNAYDTKKQLCNHTDQSLYGEPGLLLAFHCAFGEGNNSLTDGFAVAYALRERHPEQFAMLGRYGMNAGRHLGYYATGSLLFDTVHPVLRLDKAGNMYRVQYHESYRTPLTVPYDEFPAYMAALDTFYAMVHSPEFQTHIKMQQGELLIMNNWRIMHGRAGLAGKTRTILGGTVTREAFYSGVRQHAAQQAGVPTAKEVGVPTAGFALVGSAFATGGVTASPASAAASVASASVAVGGASVASA